MRNLLKYIPEIHVSAGFVFLISGAFCFGSGEMFLLAAAAAVFHELAHLMMIYLCGGRVEAINLAVYGAYIELKRYPLISYKKELLIAVAGPAVSLGLACVFSAVGNCFHSQNFYILSGINLMLGMLNLLPAYPLDGGRVLRCAMLMLSNENTAGNITAVSGGVCAAAVLLFCCFVNFRLGFQPSLTIFCVFVSVSFLKNIIVRSGGV